MKSDRIRPQRLVAPAVLALAVMLVVSGCNLPSGAQADAAPAVTVRQPAGAIVANLGEPVKVVAQSTDDQGVLRVELWADGQLSSQLPAPSPAGLKSFNAAFSWVPNQAGAHVLQVKAVDTAEQTATSPDIPVTVQIPAPPTAAPTPPPAETTVAPPTPAITSTLTPTPEEEPAVTANDTVNVRTGPGTSYQWLGQLTPGETVRAVGRNADSSWWQIAYATGVDGKAWVWGQLVTANASAQQLPVTEAPPAPTAAPTQVPTPVPTPSVLRADRTTLDASNPCTTVRWDVEGVLGVYFNGEGVGGHDSRDVCPVATTTYELKVVRSTGETIYTITITVVGGGCSGDPVIDSPLGATASTVHRDETFSLTWRVTNIRAIWLVEDGSDIPVTGTGDLYGGLAHKEFAYGETGTHHYHLKLQKCDGTIITAGDVTVRVE